MAPLTSGSVFRYLKLRTKLILLVLGVVAGTTLPLGSFIYFKNRSVLQEKTVEVCKTLALSLANLATEELLMNETYEATLTAILRLGEANIQGLVNAAVFNRDYTVVAELNGSFAKSALTTEEKKTQLSVDNFHFFSFQDKNESEILRFIAPIHITFRDQKKRVGTAIFDFDSNVIFRPIEDLRVMVVYTVIGLLFFFILLALYISYQITIPIVELTKGTQEFGLGDLSHRIVSIGTDEIAKLAVDFNSMADRIQDFTENLEFKVKERTEALAKSYEEVKLLKDSQDGDYYLTSLLINPFNTNLNIAKNTNTEIFLKQRKRFFFQEKQVELGGDACITDTVTLAGRDFTIFLNADAMGKSMQGAGGALVLLVVFTSGLVRAKESKNNDQTPENWLRERFLELQSVFLSFEGNMFISAILGMVDNQTGIMYYLNFDHPLPVLLRDEQVSWISPQKLLSKLGTPILTEEFQIDLFLLRKGDIVLFGSDGRDDLILNAKTGEMNIDETLFLKNVKESGGELERLHELLLVSGILYDDLSLLKIEFNPEFEIPDSEINKEFWSNNKLFEKAKELSFNGKSREALTYAERLYLRDSFHIQNLILLMKEHYQLGNSDQSKYYLERIQKISPEHPEMIELKKTIAL